MSTYQIIGLLGLGIGIIATAILFLEYFWLFPVKNKLIYGAGLLLGMVFLWLGITGIIDSPKAIEAYVNSGAPFPGDLSLHFLWSLAGGLIVFFSVWLGDKAQKKAGITQSLGWESLPISHVFIWLIRIYIGVLFLYSGFVKANDYIGFAYKLEEYFLVFGSHFPAIKGFFSLFVPFAEPLAWFISVFELVLAIAILTGYRMNLTAWLTLLMMVFFTALTAYSHLTGAVTDCGCFGDALKIEPWESFTKDVILMVMLIPLFLVRKTISAIPSGRIAAVLTAVTFLASGVYSWYCHENLPIIDYRAYKIGVDLKICTTQLTAEGYPKCKDWSFADEEQYLIDTYRLLPEDDSVRIKTGKAYEITPVNMFSGPTMMIVIQNVNHAPEEAMRASGQLAEALSGAGIYVVGATATGYSDMEKFIPAYDIPYPFMFMDETVLKTIIRSHPGYVLMQDGVVVKNWHYNNIPSLEEVQNLLGK
ncbi:MAG: DoxX family protein [Bacteroidia bacterium]|nr:DoxX family protein [Bacteroidia bacterium]